MQVGGAQQREFRKEILQTMQVGAGPNIEADFLSAYNNASWVGPSTKRISKGNSTDNVSWGRTK